jgi:hypothetical protein
MRIMKMILVGMAMFGMVASAAAQEAKSYKEGAVTQISYIRVKPGQFDAYMKFLGGDYKKLMEAYIKAGLVVRYGVYTTRARNPNDANLILTVTSPNYAALDKVDERDAISAKLLGNSDARTKAAIDREAMRQQLGSELVQEVILK